MPARALRWPASGSCWPKIRASWCPRSTGPRTRATALAMRFEPSEPIEMLAAAAPEVRDAAVRALLELCLRELFTFRLMQTDPNFANYRWRPETGQIVLLDFGATREISPATSEEYRVLLRAGLAGERDGVMTALETIASSSRAVGGAP